MEDCSARTEGTLAGFGLRQLVTSTAPAFQERGKKAHADVVPTERLTLIDVLRYLVKLKRARWAVPSFRVTIRSRQLPAQDFEVVAWYV